MWKQILRFTYLTGKQILRVPINTNNTEDTLNFMQNMSVTTSKYKTRFYV